MTNIDGSLAALNNARLNVADMPRWQFLELEEVLEAILAVELDAHSTVAPNLVKLSTWLATFIREGA